jgi:carbamoyltransferase
LRTWRIIIGGPWQKRRRAWHDKLNVPRSDIPAVTHVDYSARIKPCIADEPALLRADISFKQRTGCPVIVNTSFNVR